MSTTPNDPRDPQFGDQHRPMPNPAQPFGVQPGDDQPGAGQAPQHGYGRQGGKYGTSEYNPNQYTGMVERPGLLDRLLKLTLLSAALYVVFTIVSLIANSTTDLAAIYRDQGLSSEQAEMVASSAGGVVGSVIGLVIALLLYFLVYRGLAKGKNWARILGTVFAALSILSYLFGMLGALMYGGLGIVLIVIAIIAVIVDILWIVTAFKAPNSAYFAQNNRR
ncbi:hypothetical protein IEE91_02110 [Kocuria sp. cx-455]|uniref:hypothetical protein n=1 Tax=unclassified Candidatus Sulfotelmatobacter TaxID=2635724 RepID=UPI00168444D9|nr:MULTISPECIES: hypothetical protein [unclassified Candidatus Sulfotelmatobacter]MBD2761725.1 hypothetical protein [Kocuria sp. cx-116]MBD2764002.1 hypothetical protein [Kocuria sp. cx-455]